MDVSIITTSVAGSFVAGFTIGMFLRTSIKFVLLLLGMFGFALLMMQNYGLITINWNAFGELVKNMIMRAEVFAQGMAYMGLPFAIGIVTGWKLGGKKIERDEFEYV